LRKTSDLKNTLKKGIKKICENGKDGYFCTRNQGRRSLISFVKKIKKDLHRIYKGFTFAIRKTVKFFDKNEVVKRKENIFFDLFAS